MTPERAAVSSERRRIYLDTSAYLAILLAEAGSKTLSDDTEGAELVSSVLLVLEARRTLVRLARDQVLSAREYHQAIARLEEDVDRFVLRDLTLDLCLAPTLPAVRTPRSLDLAHLRTALWFHADAPLDRFVTLDSSQQDAARELGLPV